ncbi:MAG: winged helix-turn-helix domain-containing protein [Betaproteobacteria bacterium]|nr:winged helix-turn-helix domain-containing protein [Betaproteobacteria bacterium]
MRKLRIRDAEVMRIAIRQEISRSEGSRYDHRLHGVPLVANGQSRGAVAELFGENARTVQRWASRFESGGFEALREGERAGRPRSLDSRQWRALERDLRRNPRQFGHEQNLWDGKLLSAHLKSRYRISLGVRQCQRIFGRMGFRLRKPRPQVAQADPVRVTAVKKTAAPSPAR